MKHFSKKTIPLLPLAGQQTDPAWLDQHKADYDEYVRLPFIELAEHLKQSLHPVAADYHFPTKGIGRIKRMANKVMPGAPTTKIGFLCLLPSRAIQDLSETRICSSASCPTKNHGKASSWRAACLCLQGPSSSACAPPLPMTQNRSTTFLVTRHSRLGLKMGSLVLTSQAGCLEAMLRIILTSSG